MAFVQNKLGKELADDPAYQEKLKAGLIAPPKSAEDRPTSPCLSYPKGAALSAYLFLAGVVLVVLTAFPAFQQMVPDGEGGMVAVSATTIIQIIMFIVALLIVIF